MKSTSPGTLNNAAMNETTVSIRKETCTTHQSITGLASSSPTASRLPQRVEENSLLNTTVEKFSRFRCISPTEVCAAGQHSPAISRAESHDYVDDIASSAFHNCLSAALIPVTYTTQPLDSCMDAMSSIAIDPTGSGPSGFERSHLLRMDCDDYRREGREIGHSFEDNAVRQDELTDAASRKHPQGGSTIEVIVPVDDVTVPEELRRQVELEASLKAQKNSGHTTSYVTFKTLAGACEVERTATPRTQRQLPMTPGDMSTDDDASRVASAATALSVSSRHADSAEWAATRTTALEQLRANFNRSSKAVDSSTVSRRWPTRPLHPSGEKVDAPTSPTETMISGELLIQERQFFQKRPRPPFAVPNAAAIVLDELLGDSGLGRSNVMDGESPIREISMTCGNITESNARASLSETGYTPTKTTTCSGEMSAIGRSVNGSRFVIRPALSADVSGISPVKVDASSMLVDLYKTLDMRPQTPGMSPALPGGFGSTAPAGDGHRRGSPSILGTRGDLSPERTTADFFTAPSVPSTTFTSLEMTPVRDRTSTDATLPTAPTAGGKQQGHNALHKDLRKPALSSRERVPHSNAIAASSDGRHVDSALPPNTNFHVSQKALQGFGDASHVGGERILKPAALQRKECPTAEASCFTHTHEQTSLTRPTEWRQQNVKHEMEAKEMAECTFTPLLSPGTRAMVRRAQRRELQKILLDEEKASAPDIEGIPTTVAQPKLAATHPDNSTLRATLQTVYDRLYPATLSAAASRRQIVDQEMEYRRLAREEMLLLRRQCGIIPMGSRNSRGNGGGSVRVRDMFSLFMGTLLQTDWEKAVASRVKVDADALPSSDDEVHTTAGDGKRLPVVETSYRSPMAVALLEEQDAKRKYHSRRGSQTHALYPDANKERVEETAEESLRAALFDEFLLRQNAYYMNRARTVRELERQITPAFTPSTTDTSTRLVQKMVSNSLLRGSLGPETSSIVEQMEKNRIPFTSSFVKPHVSPYVDPCTFHPTISPAARAMREEERRLCREHGNKASAERPSCFDRLHMEEKRRLKRLEAAKKRAEAEEVEGLTFRPKVNARCNDGLQSVLSRRNYPAYQMSLNEKRRLVESKRKEQEEAVTQAELDKCTFRPQITKKPSYISKMAKSFGVLRQQDVEF